MSYALTPVVAWLSKTARVPKAIGAALTLAIILGGLGMGLHWLQPEALDVLDLVPRATQKVSVALRSNSRGSTDAVSKLQKAATELEKAANAAPTPVSIAATPTKPADVPAFRVRDYVLMGTVSIAAAIGQWVVIIALVYFLLIAGDSFRRTLVRISGDTLSKKKTTVHILDEIDSRSGATC